MRKPKQESTEGKSFLVLDIVRNKAPEYLMQALGKLHPVCAVTPYINTLEWLSSTHKPALAENKYRHFDCAFPDRWSGRLGQLLAPFISSKLQNIFGCPETVIFTSPAYRYIADHFQGSRRVYIAVDDYLKDYGLPESVALQWEGNLVQKVDHIFVISEVLAERFRARYGLSAKNLHILPNALPAAQIPDDLSLYPLAPPATVPSHFRPLVGVIGHISRRIRIDWLVEAVEALPSLYWVFVGPASKLEPEQELPLQSLMNNPRCAFVGKQPYRDLFAYAGALDAAVIPYNEEGANPSGSSVRLFTHLSFGQPILATRGCPQVEDFIPLVEMCSSAEELIAKLDTLANKNFDDGMKLQRWDLAKKHTWEQRAEEFCRAIFQDNHGNHSQT